MRGLLRIDGPIYNFCSIVCYLILINFFWVIFSLPIITIGASTTAMFYVMGRIVRNEETGIFNNFWKSFKMNFKQATLIWMGILVITSILSFILLNQHFFEGIYKLFLYLWIALFAQVLVVNTYIFPMLARYEMQTGDLVRTSFVLGYKHFLTTCLCILLAIGIASQIKHIGWMAVSLYGLGAIGFINRVMEKYQRT
jgi:uncharacterized membrane protein YesL